METPFARGVEHIKQAFADDSFKNVQALHDHVDGGARESYLFSWPSLSKESLVLWYTILISRPILL